MTVDLQRRRVFQSAVAGGALSLGAFVPTPVSAAVARAAADIEVMTWSGCAVNCGSRCQLRVFSKNGRVIRIETDASGDASASTIDGGCTQIRACQRGRSMRQRIYAPERLKFPMKRVGRRGEGRFERISWEQALDEIAARLKDTIDRHTNESVMIMHGSGNQALVNSSAATYRFFNMIGGSLAWYSDYSTACIQNAWPYLYGRFDYGGVRSKAAGQGSYFSQVKNAKLYVTFGNNPAVTRASGGGQSWEFFSAARRNGTRMVFIDPIYSDTMAGRNAEWIPIRPGTDAALCEAIAYVLITENLVDKAFIDRYTIGYDEDSLPASAKPGSSYRSHILGLGPDKTPKTPERAAGITNVPAERIVRLARDMAAAKPCFISQGWARRLYAEARKNLPGMPAWDEFRRTGIYKYRMEGDSGIVMEDFRRDPDKHPLETPSGRIEIYSERLAEIARTWKLPEGRGQEIHPIPRYVPTDEMVQVDPKAKQYPLEAFGYHGPGRTHSTYHNVPWLREAHPDVVLMNPVDAQPRGLKTGMLVRVFNDRGALVLPVKVTPRIIPSLVAFPQGAWYRPDEKGLDRGGCFNVLTQLKPTPLAKANPSHTNLVQVEKFRG